MRTATLAGRSYLTQELAQCRAACPVLAEIGFAGLDNLHDIDRQPGFAAARYRISEGRRKTQAVTAADDSASVELLVQATGTGKSRAR